MDVGEFIVPVPYVKQVKVIIIFIPLRLCIEFIVPVPCVMQVKVIIIFIPLLLCCFFVDYISVFLLFSFFECKACALILDAVLSTLRTLTCSILFKAVKCRWEAYSCF